MHWRGRVLSVFGTRPPMHVQGPTRAALENPLLPTVQDAPMGRVAPPPCTLLVLSYRCGQAAKSAPSPFLRGPKGNTPGGASARRRGQAFEEGSGAAPSRCGRDTLAHGHDACTTCFCDVRYRGREGARGGARFRPNAPTRAPTDRACLAGVGNCGNFDWW